MRYRVMESYVFPGEYCVEDTTTALCVRTGDDGKIWRGSLRAAERKAAQLESAPPAARPVDARAKAFSEASKKARRGKA